jgi:cytochrome b6-f complex iron-sulfur subunit
MSAETVALAKGVTRREFLNYVWGATMAVFMAEMGGAIFLYALPRFKAGEFGGTFTLPASSLPTPGSAPLANQEGRFWIANTDQGVYAIYKVCTHLGCLYGWSSLTQRFECPCHGSKFQLNGTYIEGPAPRSLDRFVIQVQDASGKVIAQTDANGGPVQVTDPNATLAIDTGKRIEGKRHS